LRIEDESVRRTTGSVSFFFGFSAGLWRRLWRPRLVGIHLANRSLSIVMAFVSKVGVGPSRKLVGIQIEMSGLFNV
jgi:hypothetical protein